MNYIICYYAINVPFRWKRLPLAAAAIGTGVEVENIKARPLD